MTTGTRETTYAETFLAAISLSARPKRGEKHPPDFIVDVKGRRVAIEITEFYQPPTGNCRFLRQQVEASGDKIVKLFTEARKDYPELANLSWLVFLRQLQLPCSKEEIPFVSELLTFTKEHLPEIRVSPRTFSMFPPDGYPLMHKYLREVEISSDAGCYMNPCLSDLNFADLNVASASLTDESLLQSCGMKKKLSPDYMNKLAANCKSLGASELWLLVVFGWKLSQAVPPLEHDGIGISRFDKTSAALRDSPYQRVFLFDYKGRVFCWPGWVDVTGKGEVLLTHG